MRRPPLRITKAPRRHPGPSSIIYFTLDAGISRRSPIGVVLFVAVAAVVVIVKSGIVCVVRSQGSMSQRQVFGRRHLLPEYLPGCSGLAVM